MKLYSAVALAAGLLASTALGADDAKPDTTGFTDAKVGKSRGGRATCISGKIAVPARTTKNTRFNFSSAKNQTVLTQVFVSLITPGANFLQGIMGGMQTVEGTYQIAGSLCVPAGGNNSADGRPSKVQLLTHGVGFDRFYWDFAPGYSYVDVAADAGYATFLYDRLGVGQSQKAEPVNVVQGQLQIAIANQLALKLREGYFAKTPYSTVVGVGHSFGSLITQSITSQFVDTFDAAILTGFSGNSSGVAPFVTGLNIAIAAQNKPSRFRGLDPGYLVASQAISNQIAFFHFPGFDAAIASQADAQKATTTYGELFTQGTLAQPAPSFAKPVAVVNGLEDLPFCLGNCSYPLDKGRAVVTALYPLAKDPASYIAPDAGHGLNLHYSALNAFKFVQDYLKRNGL